MTVKEIKIIAKKMGIKAGKMKKVDLVRTIQISRGKHSLLSDRSHCNLRPGKLQLAL